MPTRSGFNPRKTPLVGKGPASAPSKATELRLRAHTRKYAPFAKFPLKRATRPCSGYHVAECICRESKSGPAQIRRQSQTKHQISAHAPSLACPRKGRVPTQCVGVGHPLPPPPPHTHSCLPSLVDAHPFRVQTKENPTGGKGTRQCTH